MTDPSPVPFVPPDIRALAAALEAALQWSYASDMPTHIKIGFGLRADRWSKEYVRDIETIRNGVKIARKLGFHFKSLEMP